MVLQAKISLHQFSLKKNGLERGNSNLRVQRFYHLRCMKAGIYGLVTKT